MPSVSEVTPWNDTIQKGATFYREVTLYDDAEHTTLTDLTGLTVYSTLMTESGVHVANFPCAYLAATGEDPEAVGYKPPRHAWTMPQATTGTLNHQRTYLHNIDYINTATGDAYRRVKGEITVEVGQINE
jgi:hypothetical protein